MNEFYLFLDESKPNTNFKNFTLGGVVIEKGIYENFVKTKIRDIKIDCFGSEEIILHEIDIRKKCGEFKNINYETQKKFFDQMKAFFLEMKFMCLAVSINIEELDNLYNIDSRNDIYYIALQLLLENYAHFLVNNNGTGSIYLESTDQSSDSKLQNLYFSLLASGTLFLKKEFLQERLKTINFGIKTDNNTGLQIADLVPNALARDALGKKQKPNSLFEEIKKILYDGTVHKPERFGFKIVS